MTRLYERVRREFGPDAVIVRTRSLLREGAEPLIELIAAPPQSDAELALDLQWKMVDGALGRLQIAKPRATIGDLEDIAAREAEVPPRPRLAAPLAAEGSEPGWLEGFVAEAPAPRAAEAVRRTPSWRDGNSGPAHEEDPVPRAHARTPRAFPAQAPRTQRDGGVLDLLIDGGLTREAAVAVTRFAPGEQDPAAALAACLGQVEPRYPSEEHRAVIAMLGPEGAGRTTALVRMALDCADAGRDAALVAADSARAAAREQLHAYADAAGLRIYDAQTPDAIAAIAARSKPGSCLFADVPAGLCRLPTAPGVELHRYLTLPGHWQRDVLRRAAGGFDTTGFSGAVITCSDLATDLSPAISMAIEAGLGLAFLSSGRDVGSGLLAADPAVLASGLFPMGHRESTDGQLVAAG